MLGRQRVDRGHFASAHVQFMFERIPPQPQWRRLVDSNSGQMAILPVPEQTHVQFYVSTYSTPQQQGTRTPKNGAEQIGEISEVLWRNFSPKKKRAEKRRSCESPSLFVFVAIAIARLVFGLDLVSECVCVCVSVCVCVDGASR
jgi:hypothetical protein